MSPKRRQASKCLQRGSATGRWRNREDRHSRESIRISGRSYGPREGRADGVAREARDVGRCVGDAQLNQPNLRPRLRAPSLVPHHAQEAVDAEPRVPEAGVGVILRLRAAGELSLVSNSWYLPFNNFRDGRFRCRRVPGRSVLRRRVGTVYPTRCPRSHPGPAR
jgi:hypothetical protein